MNEMTLSNNKTPEFCFLFEEIEKFTDVYRPFQKPYKEYILKS